MEPIALFEAAVAALSREDWLGVARLCDPASLGAFKRQMLEQFAPAMPAQQITVEEYLRHSPEMPHAVAEYHVAQGRLQLDPATRIAERLPGVTTVGELAALVAEEVFVKWLVGRSPRWHLERFIAQGRAVLSEAELSEALAMSAQRYTVLGVVADGEHVVHVIYRHVFDTSDVDFDTWLAKRPLDEQELGRDLFGRGHIMATQCRRQPDGGWLLIADDDFLQLSNFSVAVDTEDDSSAPPASPP